MWLCVSGCAREQPVCLLSVCVCVCCVRPQLLSGPSYSYRYFALVPLSNRNTPLALNYTCYGKRNSPPSSHPQLHHCHHNRPNHHQQQPTCAVKRTRLG